MSDTTLAPVDGQEHTPRPKPPGPKVRLVSVSLQLNAVIDDGTSLRGLQVAPVHVEYVDWAAFNLAAQVADLQHQVDQQQPRG